MEGVLLVALIVIGTSIWVGFDAKDDVDQGAYVVLWFFGCLALWIVVFPLYLLTKFSRMTRDLSALREKAKATAMQAPDGSM